MVEQIQSIVTEIVRIKQVVIERPIEYQGRISSTKLAAQIGMAEIGDEAQEVFLLVVLNTQNEINAIHRVFQESLNSSVAQPREIFRSAILNNGDKIMLYHNHPSGNLEPSQADLYFTARIVEAGIILGIEVLDHIIVSDRHWFSFKDFGFFEEI